MFMNVMPSMEGLNEMSSTKLAAVCLVLLSILMTGLGSEMEASAIKAVRQHTYAANPSPRGAGYEMMAEPAKADKTEEKIEIIRDRFLMFLIGGGAFGGAVVCVVIRRAWADNDKDKTRMMMGAYFSVSILTSVFVSPLAIKKFLPPGPEECFAGAFALAFFAWLIYELLAIIGVRLKKAAEARGWLGVKDEILGGNIATVTATPSTPSPPPVVPTGDKP